METRPPRQIQFKNLEIIKIWMYKKILKIPWIYGATNIAVLRKIKNKKAQRNYNYHQEDKIPILQRREVPFPSTNNAREVSREEKCRQKAILVLKERRRPIQLYDMPII